MLNFKADNSELETATRSKFKHKILCQLCLSQSIKTFESKWPKKTWENYIFRPSRVANSIVSSGIRLKFKLIQAFMHTLVTYKNEENQIKNEGAGMATTFLPL